MEIINIKPNPKQTPKLPIVIQTVKINTGNYFNNIIIEADLK